MGEVTSIAWCHHTFNPWRGCEKVSPGCANCYAEQMSHRNSAVLGEWGRNGVRALAAESYWRQPLRWNLAAKAACERRRVFCASLSDVFEDRAELIQERARLFGLIQSTPNLDWLLLTKRTEIRARLLELRGFHALNSDQASGVLLAGRWLDGQPPSNVWLGVSAEDQARADERIPMLLDVPAAKRFVSYEPALGPVDFTRIMVPSERFVSCWNVLTGFRGNAGGGHVSGKRLDWIIVGGESNGSRPFHVSWARSVVAQCREAGVAAFVKQLGSNPVDDTGARVILRDKKHGADPDEWPKDLRVREVPHVA